MFFMDFPSFLLSVRGNCVGKFGDHISSHLPMESIFHFGVKSNNFGKKESFYGFYLTFKI